MNYIFATPQKDECNSEGLMWMDSSESATIVVVAVQRQAWLGAALTTVHGHSVRTRSSASLLQLRACPTNFVAPSLLPLPRITATTHLPLVKEDLVCSGW